MDYSQQYARFHPDNAAHRNGLTLLHRRLLLPHLPADKSSPILDVGCGRGYALQDVRGLGYTCLAGIDSDAGQADFARGLGLEVQFCTDTLAYLNARPVEHAVVLLMDVLEHIPRDQQRDFLQAVIRTLQPGGRLICTVPNAACGIGSYWRYNDYTHHASFTDDSLAFLLGQAGFAAVQCLPVEFFLRPRFLFWLPSRRTLSWLMRVHARLRHRMEFIGELGWDRGRRVILTPNLLAVAMRPGA